MRNGSIQDGSGNNISAFTYRNKLINGSFDIWQRGTSFSSPNAYTADRWSFNGGSAGSFTVGQNVGSLTPPAGFTSYFGVQMTATATVAAGTLLGILQPIEGLNCQDLAYGSSSARTTTLSFWAYSSIAGTYTASLRNSALSRSYLATFTLSAATWTQIILTIAGDTSGTWLTTNGVGVYLSIYLAGGSTYQSSTVGSWQAGNYNTYASQTQFCASSGAVFGITGVQFEVGSFATPIERRPYALELSLCQRYFEKSYAVGTAPGATAVDWNSFSMPVGWAGATNGVNLKIIIPFKVAKRALPTMAYWDGNGNASKHSTWNSANTRTDNVSSASAFFAVSDMSAMFNTADLGSIYTYGIHWTASAEL